MFRPYIYRVVVFVLATVFAVAAGAADLPPRERNWLLRFGPMIVDGDGGATVSSVPGDVHFGANIGAGGGGSVSLERRVTPLMGVEFGIAAAGLDLGFRVGAGTSGVGTSTDLLMFTPITVGANFHLVPEGPVDVYIGPMLAFVRYSELLVTTGIDDWPWWPGGSTASPVAAVRWKSDSELTWGARLGAGFSFGKGRWSLQTSLSFIDATYTAERGSDSEVTTVNMDPLMFSIGAGFRF